MAHDTPLSRRAALVISAAALAGSGSLASTAALPLPAVAEAHPDAVLIEAWAEFRKAWAQNLAINERSEPMFMAALASMPKHPFEAALVSKEIPEGTDWHTLSQEEQDVWEDIRLEQYREAFDRYGVTAAQKEQDHLFKTVIDPLAEKIRYTVPATAKGVAIKTAYLQDHEPDEAFWAFIDQLADEALS
jgi:hypothetical protein